MKKNQQTSYDKQIEMFLDELPRRIRQMQEAFDKNDLQDLALQIQELKSFGELEHLPIQNEKLNIIEKMMLACQMDELRGTLDELVQLCVQTRLTRF